MFNKKHFDHRLDLLELYLTVRDPGTARAADAYDGLRKLLIRADKGTQVHLAQLATLHRAANSADSLDPIRSKIEEMMSQMGLIPVSDPAQRDLYQVTGGKGDLLVIDVPAYVSLEADGSSRLVQQGAAHLEDGGHVLGVEPPGGPKSRGQESSGQDESSEHSRAIGAADDVEDQS